MNLGISRECVGDILVSEGRSAAFLKNSIAEDVLQNIRKIGRTGVKVYEGYDESIVPKVNIQEISGTVASLRIDCILSLVLRISREKAAALIKNTGVDINYLTHDSPDFCIGDGDKFSVRGYGKFILISVNGTTKKDRLHITVGKYI